MKKIIYILVTVMSICILSGCKKIELKNINIEAGKELPADINYYLSKKVKNTSNYQLDISNVNINVIGEYKYTIKKNNQVFEGIIKVTDTTKPYVELSDIYIEVGDSINLTDFVTYYKDASTEYNTTTDDIIKDKLNMVGDIDIYLEISDLNNNSVGQTGTIHVLPKGTLDEVRENDLIAYMHDASERKLDIDKLMKNYYIKFDKAIPVTDVKSVIGVSEEKIKEYVKNKNYEIIGIYNKYRYLIAVTIRVTEQDGDKTIVSYLHPDDLK